MHTRTSRLTILGLALLCALCTVSSGLAQEQEQEHRFTTIDIRGANGTMAFGINSEGNIVGFYFNPNIHGFLLSEDGALTTIDVPGAFASFAQGINPQGDIVGLYFTATGGEHGFLLSK